MSEKEPTTGEKVKHFQMGCAMAGVFMDIPAAEISVRVYEMTQQKGGSFSLEDAVTIEVEVREKYYPKEKTANHDTKEV